MNSKEIYRLCLKVANYGFWRIDDTMKELLDILLLKLDLDMTRDPIICQDCAEVAKKCLNFKAKCIDTEQFILSFSAGMGKSKQGIKLIYAKRGHLVLVTIEGLDLCRFCMFPLERNNFAHLNTLLDETMFEMITKYMPEMDFNVCEYPKICITCRENLEGYSLLILNCFDTETKIKAYCKEDKSDNKNVINLDSVLHFLFKDIVKYPVEYQIHKTKQEPNLTEGTDCIHSEAYIGLIKQEKLYIEDEKIGLNEDTYETPSEIILNKYNDTFPSKIYESDVISLKTRRQNIEEYPDQQQIQGNNMKGIIMETSMHRDVLEENTAEQRKSIERNLIATSGAPDLDINKYAKAVSEAKLESYMLVLSDVREMTMYKCALCRYESKRKSDLKTHMFVHKDDSEVQMFRCGLCAYKAKTKRYLARHMLTHKDVSEIEMFKCALCIYKSKRKRNLNRHMLVHKDVSQIKMYKCALCAYEAKTKFYLKTHMLVHKDVSEEQMVKCSLCAYETKRKSYLKKHILIHTDVSKMKMFKCALCAYESKRKSQLTGHMLVHKDISEIKTFKCALCAYEAKTKPYLGRHMLTHKDVSKIKMFKCTSCAYESKRKSCLEIHMLAHKDISEIKMFNCVLCAYETKSKTCLNVHMLVHKDVSEIKMFKCALCAYEAKRKSHLTAHMLVHKDVSKIEMFKCSLCAFQTKRKTALNKHMLVHT